MKFYHDDYHKRNLSCIELGNTIPVPMGIHPVWSYVGSIPVRYDRWNVWDFGSMFGRKFVKYYCLSSTLVLITEGKLKSTKLKSL